MQPKKRGNKNRPGKNKLTHAAGSSFMKYATAVALIAGVLFFVQNRNIAADKNSTRPGPSQAELISNRYQEMVKRAPLRFKKQIRKLRREELQAIKKGEDRFMTVSTNAKLFVESEHAHYSWKTTVLILVHTAVATSSNALSPNIPSYQNSALRTLITRMNFLN